MYKVFIDNYTLYIATSLEVFPELKSKEIEIIELDMFLKNQPLMQTPNMPVNCAVITADCDRAFKKIFKNHQKITAAGGIVKRGDEYLFIKRHGLWDIPKGKVEKGEDVQIAAVREIEEECGISDPKIVREITKTYHTYNFKGKDVLKKTYWYLMSYDKMEELIPQTEEGITEVKWFKKDEFDVVIKETYPSIIDVIEFVK